MYILDLSSDFMQLDSLIGDTASISKVLTIFVIILTIGAIVILPIFMYLKYLMNVKIVKTGTLQALNEFYYKQQVNNTMPTNNKTIPINNDNNSNKEQQL